MPNSPIRVFEGFPHVLRSQQFDPDDLRYLFQKAEAVRHTPSIVHGLLTGQRIAILFSEPSSRTFNSFIEAAELLDARVRANQHMALFSSEVKGESIADTISVFTAYGYRYFVLRRKEEGGVDEAAVAAGPSCSVINAGDGAGQHPTQALLDVYTIWREFTLDRPLSVGLLGDLRHGRTVHSLVYLLAKFPNVSFAFFSPESVRMKEGILEHLREHGRMYAEYFYGDLRRYVGGLDVLYVTRPQIERVASDEERQAMRNDYRLWTVTPEVADAMPASGIIMHPLPRNEELPTTLDGNPRARWREQMANGLWIRAALLAWIQEIRDAHAG